MKKGILVSLSLLPVFIGYLINYSTRVPLVGVIISYIISAAVLVFWFILGRRYSHTNWNLIVSTLTGNALGLISLFVYIWQFLWISDAERNLTLAGLSQMFSASTNFVAARIAILLEADKDVVSKVFFMNMEIIGLIIMIIIFISGFIVGKRGNRHNPDQSQAKDYSQNAN